MREQAQLEPINLCTLRGPGPKTDWNSDWRLTGTRTTNWQHFFCPGVVCNNNKTKRKGGWQGGAAAGLLTTMCQNGCQTSFFGVVSEVHKDSEDISAGIGIF
jgi:hypothetical protein